MKKVLLAITVACSFGAPVVAMATTASSGQHHAYHQPVPSTNNTNQPKAAKSQLLSSKVEVPGPVSLQSILNKMSLANQQKFLQAMKDLPKGNTKTFTQVEWKNYLRLWFTNSMIMDEAQGYISQANGDTVTRQFSQELRTWNESDALRVKIPFNVGVETWSLWNVTEKTVDIHFNA